MSTSIHQGIVKFPEFSGSFGLPIGPHITRNIIINNLLHAADEMAQPRAAMHTSGSLQIPESIDSLGEFFKIASTGPFRLPMRQNGAGYKLRIRIAASCSGSTGAGQIFVQACPSYLNARAVTEDFVWESSTFTNVNPEWIAGTTQGSNADSMMLYIAPEFAADWFGGGGTQSSTLTDIAGTAVSTPGLEISVEVWGRVTHASRIIKLHSFYVAEYLG